MNTDITAKDWTPMISIIIAVYNEEERLGRCIQSVLPEEKCRPGKAAARGKVPPEEKCCSGKAAAPEKLPKPCPPAGRPERPPPEGGNGPGGRRALNAGKASKTLSG